MCIVYTNRNQKYFLVIVVTIARCINLLSFTKMCRSMLLLSSNNNKVDAKQTDLLKMLFIISPQPKSKQLNWDRCNLVSRVIEKNWLISSLVAVQFLVFDGDGSRRIVVIFLGIL